MVSLDEAYALTGLALPNSGDPPQAARSGRAGAAVTQTRRALTGRRAGAAGARERPPISLPFSATRALGRRRRRDSSVASLAHHAWPWGCPDAFADRAVGVGVVSAARLLRRPTT